MALLKYFKHIKPSKEERIQSVLPKPDGPLARLKLSSAIEDDNSAVRGIFTDGTINEGNPTPCDQVTLNTVRGTYQMLPNKEKAEFAKRAAENGITATIRYFIKNEHVKNVDQQRTLCASFCMDGK